MTIHTPQELGRTTYRCNHPSNDLCLNCIVRSADDGELRADVARVALFDLRDLARLRAADGRDFAVHWFAVVERDRMAVDIRSEDPERRVAAKQAKNSVSDFRETQRAFRRTDGPPKRMGRRLMEIMQRAHARLEAIGREGGDPDLVPVLN
jgi:hypothetical protein